MRHDRSAAMFARIGAYGRIAAVLLRHLRARWDTPVGDKREAHYLRGPGPKCREKRVAQEERS